MASSINLHHKCLRSRLKTFSGYEIATEGDSFKCAFRKPEDAILWAVMVQVSGTVPQLFLTCDSFPLCDLSLFEVCSSCCRRKFCEVL
jgi:hypothetical protein